MLNPKISNISFSKTMVRTRTYFRFSKCPSKVRMDHAKIKFNAIRWTLQLNKGKKSMAINSNNVPVQQIFKWERFKTKRMEYNIKSFQESWAEDKSLRHQITLEVAMMSKTLLVAHSLKFTTKWHKNLQSLVKIQSNKVRNTDSSSIIQRD